MAGSKKDNFENALLLLIFNNTTITGIGSDGMRGATTAGSLYVALYTANPADGTAGTEAAYTNYARVAVARSAAGWTVSGNNASTTAAVNMPTCGATGATITGMAICKAGTAGVDDAIYWASLTTSKTVANGDTISFAIGDIDVTED